MKNLIKIIIFGIILASSASCSDWNEQEAKDFIQTGKSEGYYEALRLYKQSDHPVTFGWFGNWTGTGASLSNSMAGLPDSVDFISIWGAWRNPTAERLKDLRFVQEVKGTKALMCFIISDIGVQLTPAEHASNANDMKAYWGWIDNDKESIRTAIEKYANAICDTIDKYNYDGFDIDYEPNWGAPGNLASSNENMTIFVEALAKRIGPKSGTGRLLVIDGEPQTIAPATGPCFDWFIVQAYTCHGDYDLDARLGRTIRNFDGVLAPEEVAKRYIVTENFEKYASAGGVVYKDRDNNQMQSLEGMARWTPIVNGVPVRKGGIGTYHMEYEFTVASKTGTYPYLRRAIQIMNVPVQ